MIFLIVGPLQSSTPTPQDLADIVRNLDQLKAEQLDGPGLGGESHNYDDSGFFSTMGSSPPFKRCGRGTLIIRGTSLKRR